MDLSTTTTTVSGTRGNIFASTVGMTKPSYSETIDASNLVAGDLVGDAFPGILPQGFPLGRITADGTVAKYDATNEDGTEVFIGITGEDVYVASATSIVHCSRLTHAVVIEDNLPETIDTAGKAALPTMHFE